MTIIITLILVWLLILTAWIGSIAICLLSGQYEMSIKAMLLIRRMIKKMKKEFPDFDPEKGELTNGQD